jgi:hypothetical protein
VRPATIAVSGPLGIPFHEPKIFVLAFELPDARHLRMGRRLWHVIRSVPQAIACSWKWFLLAPCPLPETIRQICIAPFLVLKHIALGHFVRVMSYELSASGAMDRFREIASSRDGFYAESSAICAVLEERGYGEDLRTVYPETIL